MKKAWRKIERLIANNARHRSGFSLQETELPFVLSQAQGEMNELAAAPDDPTELADLLGVLIHYAIKQGWTMELIESYLVEKLDARFTANRESEAGK